MPDALVHGGADEGWGAVADAFARNFTEHGDVGAACAVRGVGTPPATAHREMHPREGWPAAASRFPFDVPWAGGGA